MRVRTWILIASVFLVHFALKEAKAAVVTTTTLTNGQSFDFFTQTFGSLLSGDLYYSAANFWSNNNPQRGVRDIGAVPLLSISSIPSSGYTTQGVPAVVGDSYIALGHQGQEGNYVFFQVTAKTNSSVTVNSIVGPTAPAAPAATPEPGGLVLLFSGLVAVAVIGKRHAAVKFRRFFS